MSKHWKPRRKTIELRPSRIRRDPAPLEKEVQPPSPKREAWATVAGVVLFAAACAALTVGISEATSNSESAAATPSDTARFGQCYNHPGPNCVLDGETVIVGGKTVEIAGMDVPEIGEAACPEEANRGIDAAVRLLELLNSGTVTIAGTQRDSDGHLRSRVAVDGRDVAQAMIRAGVAREYGSGRKTWC